MQDAVMDLLLYGEMTQEEVLWRMGGIIQDWKSGEATKQQLVHRVYRVVKQLLDLGTTYGFDENLWQDYLTFYLITNENSFSLTCERTKPQSGSINALVKADLEVFRQLYHYDFSALEQALGITCLTEITHYHAIGKREQVYHKTVSSRVRRLSRALAAAKNAEEMFDLLTQYYQEEGVGIFGLYRAFHVEEGPEGVQFLPVSNAGQNRLSDLVGYESQKQQLRENTEAFLAGRTANNVLLYGDSGTGKSSSVKALMNEYGDQGMRLIEIYKHQFRLLSPLIARLKKRNYRFIIYMDDLSFEADEVEYKFLKAVMEGGVETKPDNILLYATSNRRHLIKETWNDRNDMEFQNEIHRSDTMEEKLSLAARFGILIGYTSPNRKEFYDIVETLASRHPEIQLSKEELLAEANRWELRHGGVSGRTAQQFINALAGKAEKK